MILLVIFLFVLAAVFFLKAARQRRETGLPDGRVVYADTNRWARVEKPFYDAVTGLTGKPDYVVEHNGKWIPVEVKSGNTPVTPYDGHIYQLAAYCLLVEKAYGVRPPHGILHYPHRTFAIDYTPDLEQKLAQLVSDIHACDRGKPPARSHELEARCAKCGYRSLCEQSL